MIYNVIFSLATNDDIEDLIEIQNKAFYDDYIKYGECPGYGRTYESMKLSVENCAVYKIMVDEILVGNIIVRDNHDGTYFLGGLCVIPAYENNGIGQVAMKFLDRQFKGAHHWSLETPADKERNHYFYKKCGFHITKEYKVSTVNIVLFEKSVTV
ncbi:GNAT family N-acetyltransferase [Aminipila sp.]|uniref:GNAT family N-acetyltransferase n=1 Tax=Aminipila sp. TaxID=2060095 RepID=UPI002899C29A|nr:GNAT family N-acetyltransferase [Aminipila sp.]